MAEDGDWLSRLLELVTVHGRVDYRCLFGAPWLLDHDEAAPGEIPYHIILAGSALLETGSRTRTLTAGDILLLPRGQAHVLRDGSGAAPAPAREQAGAGFTRVENDGAGARLDMLCGHFRLAAAHARLIRAALPPLLVVSAAADAPDPPGTRAQLAGLVSLLRHESAGERPGGLAMLNALSTALFALVLRLAGESVAAPEGLLALAAHPRLAPALDALFARPEHPWTLPELAALSHMSRATFIRQFRDRLGRSAIALLTDIRMTVAANALRDRAVSTGAVAERAGYQSEAAFQRAFKQHMGETPAQFRRNPAP